MSLFHEGGEETDALEKDEVTFAPYLPHTDLNNTSCPKGDRSGNKLEQNNVSLGPERVVWLFRTEREFSHNTNFNHSTSGVFNLVYTVLDQPGDDRWFKIYS